MQIYTHYTNRAAVITPPPVAYYDIDDNNQAFVTYDTFWQSSAIMLAGSGYFGLTQRLPQDQATTWSLAFSLKVGGASNEGADLFGIIDTARFSAAYSVNGAAFTPLALQPTGDYRADSAPFATIRGFTAGLHRVVVQFTATVNNATNTVFLDRLRVHSAAALAEMYADNYRRRVEAAGMAVWSLSQVTTAYGWLISEGVRWDNSHWSSAQFGLGVSAGTVSRMYCLFGNDAVGGAGADACLYVAPATGKAPQIAYGHADTAMNIGGWTWADKSLACHAISYPTARYAGGGYPYNPIIEKGSAISMNGKVNFIIGWETGSEFLGYVMEEGANRGLYGGAFPLNQTHSTYLVTNPAGATFAEQCRLVVNGAGVATPLNPSPLPPAPYTDDFIVVGRRGIYRFAGNINDVFIVNKVVSSSFLAYLDSQKTAY